MTKEELIAEAKRRYPIGTKFKCVHGNKTFSYNNKPVIEEDTEFKITDARGSLECYININQWLYLDDKWAEIISLPEPKEVTNYPIY